MKCPNCNETLLMTQRNNIEIDYCPSCRGVWLDKGELDKMLDYATKFASAPQGQVFDSNPNLQEHKYKHSYSQQKPYKKKSFLSDLFDFD